MLCKLVYFHTPKKQTNKKQFIPSEKLKEGIPFWQLQVGHG